LAVDGGVWSASCPNCLTPEERGLVPTGQEAGWVPEAVWMQLRRKKSSLLLLGIEIWLSSP